jgi:hypothetical protein
MLNCTDQIIRKVHTLDEFTSFLTVASMTEQSRPNPANLRVKPDMTLPVRPDTSKLASSTVENMICLPICPYCHNPVPKEELDQVHYPISKCNGGTVTLPGHHLCNLAAEGNAPNINAVRKAYAVYKATMRVEVAVGQQNRALLRLRETENPAWTTIQKTIHSQRTKALRDLSATIKNAAETDQTVKWLTGIKGIGPVITGDIVSYLWPLSRFRKVSSLWHYTGLHVVGGHKPKLVQGKKADWNRQAFCALLDLNQLIKGKNMMRDLYIKFRAIEDEKHPDLTRGHRMNRALRRARKEFLKQLWLHNRRDDAETKHVSCENPLASG